jgi:hypothetical protein
VREIDLRTEACGVEREDAPVQCFGLVETALPVAHLSEKFQRPRVFRVGDGVVEQRPFGLLEIPTLDVLFDARESGAGRGAVLRRGGGEGAREQ